jgi:hypothetical protein
MNGELHKEEHRNAYYSRNAVRIIKSRQRKGEKNESYMEKINFGGKDLLRALKVSVPVNGSIILNIEITEQAN